MKYRLIKKYKGLINWIELGDVVEFSEDGFYFWTGANGAFLTLPAHEVERGHEYWEKVDEVEVYKTRMAKMLTEGDGDMDELEELIGKVVEVYLKSKANMSGK
jgi:hypothetical protein